MVIPLTKAFVLALKDKSFHIIRLLLTPVNLAVAITLIIEKDTDAQIIFRFNCSQTMPYVLAFFALPIINSIFVVTIFVFKLFDVSLTFFYE